MTSNLLLWDTAKKTKLTTYAAASVSSELSALKIRSGFFTQPPELWPAYPIRQNPRRNPNTPPNIKFLFISILAKSFVHLAFNITLFVAVSFIIQLFTLTNTNLNFYKPSFKINFKRYNRIPFLIYFIIKL